MYGPAPNFSKQFILCPLPPKETVENGERHGKISPYSVKFWNSDKLIKDNLLKMPITIKGKQCWKSTHNFPPSCEIDRASGLYELLTNAKKNYNRL